MSQGANFTKAIFQRMISKIQFVKRVTLQLSILEIFYFLLLLAYSPILMNSHSPVVTFTCSQTELRSFNSIMILVLFQHTRRKTRVQYFILNKGGTLGMTERYHLIKHKTRFMPLLHQNSFVISEEWLASVDDLIVVV